LFEPYLVYLKMAFHLSEDARAGIAELGVPDRIGSDLLDFQTKALQIAGRHLFHRRGVLVGDVVGLGKSMVGAALAALSEETFGTSTLIVCPKNLVGMWRDLMVRYELRGEVQSLSRIRLDLDDVYPEHGLVLVDESHNLRNPETASYRALHRYIDRCGSRCVLLSATPYNKAFTDLGAQLSLFVSDDSRAIARLISSRRSTGGHGRSEHSRRANTLRTGKS